ncbi:hypothetical protein MTYM_01686 [Methylococcales bacterium]|nr:hypothetical protein MTYM_01686 [Methylococcales bacterium]
MMSGIYGIDGVNGKIRMVGEDFKRRYATWLLG